MEVTKTIREIKELTPNAQKACELFLEECKKAGLKVLITETYRSQARQDYLYEQGRTRSGKIVTWTKKSRHTSRRAWDICQNIKGHEYDDPEFFKRCGAIAEKLGIIWGGTWKTPDTPHFEVPEAWNYPKGVKDEMTEAEKAKFNELTNTVKELSKKVKELSDPMIYNYIDKNMPEWAREGVRFCVEKGYIRGTEKGLELDDKDLRYCTIIKRICDGFDTEEN